jgi:hypothetical protein
MSPVLDDPLDPDEFGPLFARALSSLCDPGTTVDSGAYGHTYECSIIVCATGYTVSIVPDAPLIAPASA